MYHNLFEKIDYTGDAFWIVKDALNSLDGYSFPKAVGYWINGIGYGGDGGGCDFPEDDDTFEGVRCYYLGGFEEEEIIVSEDVFYEHLKIACQRYIELNPDRRKELEQTISQSTLV